MMVFAELNESGDRVEVHFKYNEVIKNRVKSIPGARFIPHEKGGPHWQLPLDLVCVRALREKFGNDLELGMALKRWGRNEVRKERQMRALAGRDDVPLTELKLSKKLPELAEWFRPYQRADVKFLGTGSALNLNQPGLGKTTETIAAVYEADLENGPHLVILPTNTPIETVWRFEIERWTDVPVYTWWAGVTASERRQNLDAIAKHLKGGHAFWFVTTASMVRDGLPGELAAITWNSVTIDEYHKTGLAEIKNKFPKAVNKIKAKRRFALSGTPMGGKPIKLWGGLHFVAPEKYTSKWRWAEQWLEVIEEQVYVKGGSTRTTRKIGKILPGKEDLFWESFSTHAIRRLKSEVLTELPPKLHIDVMCDMSPRQAKQYAQFAADAELRIEEEHLTGTGVLDEYTRLKVLADAYCPMTERKQARCDKCRGTGRFEEFECAKCAGTGIYSWLKLLPSTDSGKFPVLIDKLAEVGIDPGDMEGDAQAVVASQFTEVVDVVHAHLNELGIPAAKITGKVGGKKRAEIQRAFQAGDGPRVCVINTAAGGVSITLDRADTVHVLDETWNPDDQEQLEDRLHRASRIHQVTAYYYRSKNSIDQYIHEVTAEKMVTNENILDLRRQGFRATIRKEAA